MASRSGSVSGPSGGGGGGSGGLRAELSVLAERLQRRRQAAEAARERLQRDLRERRRAMDGAFRWLGEVLTAQRRHHEEEADRVERSCRVLLDRRSAELRTTREAIVTRLGGGGGRGEGDPDLMHLRDAATAALDAGQRGGGDSDGDGKGEGEGSLAQEAVEQLRLRQHRWQVDFEAWLKAMPGIGGTQDMAARSRHSSDTRDTQQHSEHYTEHYYSQPLSGPPLNSLPRRPCAPLPTSGDPAGGPRYWSPGEASAPAATAPAGATGSTRRASSSGSPEQQPQRQLRTSGCPVSIAFAGPPENLLFVAEEFEDERPNQVNVYTAQGRMVGAVAFSPGPDGRPVNPYRLAWCPQSQRLLLLSYDGRQCTRPHLVDRRGRPSEPFTTAARALNLDGLEPLDIATADPPGLAFLCCPGHGILILDLYGRRHGCHQLGIGAPVAASWSGAAQQLAVLHSESQPAFRLSLFSLTEGSQPRAVRLVTTCDVAFESVDPPLVIWDGPRVLVVKATDETGGGCLDVYAVEPGCRPAVEATRLLWRGGDRRNPIHCCLCLHDGQRHLCICDRNHQAVLTCLV